MKTIFRIVLFSLFATAAITLVRGQTKRPSERMAATVMTLWKNAGETTKPEKWSYEQGVLLKGIEGVWLNTANGQYFKYIEQSLDRFMNDDGAIRTYKLDDYNIDNVLLGRNLLLLYKVTGQEKYRKEPHRRLILQARSKSPERPRF